MALVYDLETNGLLRQTTEIHCGVIYDTNTQTSKMYSSRPMKGTDGTIDEMLEILHQADTIVGHNIIKFDNAVIRKLYGIDLTKDCNCIDTLICSKLMYPDMMKEDARRFAMPSKLKGRHSLAAWGYRTKTMKDDYSGTWDTLNQEMFDYCRQDGVATNAIYEKFLEKGLPPQEALDLENGFADIITRQELRGVKFDVKSAQALHIELEEAKEEAHKALMEAFPPLPIWTKQVELKVKVKKDGTNSMAYQKQLDKGCMYHEDTLEWGFYATTEFKPTSGKHLVYWIEELYGKQKWTLTEKGTPKTGGAEITEMFSDKDWAKPLLHYMEVNKLLSQLATGKQAWLNLVEDDGRIYGSVDTLGAVTRRCTHSRPNMAQVPSVGGFKGAECRKLFVAPKGFKIVGCDASGLELRVLAHFMAKYDGGAYGKTILEGDIHTANQKAAGLPTRNNAKTFIYGFLYGAGAAKLGEIVGGGFKEGDKLKKRFLRKLPAIAKLGEAVVGAVKRNGTLKALDGNPYMIRSEHSALNVLLQGAGALVMKYWLIEYDKQLQSEFKVGEDYEFVLNIHDEAQVECRAEIAERVGEIAEKAFETITEQIGFRIKLEGEAKIGDTWYDTH
jgi:DNA polymerase I-like protein with 3'-5' exonuclease and polymerase domains